MRTGRGGKGWGSRYDVCIDEEELAEERRVVRKAEVEDTGARRAPGRVTGKQMYIVILHVTHIDCNALKIIKECDNMTLIWTLKVGIIF